MRALSLSRDLIDYPRQHSEPLHIGERARRYCRALYHRLVTRGSFRFQGEDLDYYYHPYNHTYKNERAVELPVICAQVDGVDPATILEVGHVLGHYRACEHTVIDKYETHPEVVNADVLDFDPPRKYERIICISTLEHIGQDYGEEADAAKPLRAVERMKQWLTPGGELWVTVPRGENPHVDRALDHDAFGFEKSYFWRYGRQRWQQTERRKVRQTSYGDPYPFANGLTIGCYRAGGER